MQKSYHVRAIWDDEAQVYYCKSDIVGLHVEATTEQEFQSILDDVAAELIFANRVSANELASTPIRDLIPTIIWEKPERMLASA